MRSQMQRDNKTLYSKDDCQTDSFSKISDHNFSDNIQDELF